MRSYRFDSQTSSHWCRTRNVEKAELFTYLTYMMLQTCIHMHAYIHMHTYVNTWVFNPRGAPDVAEMVKDTKNGSLLIYMYTHTYTYLCVHVCGVCIQV